jgi:hypothetical protein
VNEASQSPRALRQDERRLLEHLLAIDEPRFELLREQATRAEVIGSEPGLITLTVPRTAPAAASRPGPVVFRSASRDPDREFVDVTLWITEDGYLDSIEIMGLENTVDHIPLPEQLGQPEGS